MPAFLQLELDLLQILAHRRLRQGNRRRRLEPHAANQRHPGGDSPQQPPVVIPLVPRAADRIVVPAAAPCHHLVAGSHLARLNRVQPAQTPHQPQLEAGVERLPGQGRHMDRHHLHRRADRVSFLARLVDQLRCLSGKISVESVYLRLFQFGLQHLDLLPAQPAVGRLPHHSLHPVGQPSFSPQFPHLANRREDRRTELIRQEDPGDRPADHVRNGRPVAGTAAAAHIHEPPGLVVFYQIRVPGPHLSLRPGELRVVGRALGRRQHGRGDRLASGVPPLVRAGGRLFPLDADPQFRAGQQPLVVLVVQPGEENHLVRLASGRAQLVAARPAAIQKALHILPVHLEPGRTSEDDGGDRRPVRLASASHREERTSQNLHALFLSKADISFTFTKTATADRPEI